MAKKGDPVIVGVRQFVSSNPNKVIVVTFERGKRKGWCATILTKQDDGIIIDKTATPTFKQADILRHIHWYEEEKCGGKLTEVQILPDWTDKKLRELKIA